MLTETPRLPRDPAANSVVQPTPSSPNSVVGRASKHQLMESPSAMQTFFIEKATVDTKLGVVMLSGGANAQGQAEGQGVRIISLEQGGLAAAAGLELGMRVVSINGRTVEAASETTKLLKEATGVIRLQTQEAPMGYQLV